MRTLVVIPTYDEAENIEPLVHRLRALEQKPDVVIVDDNSPDGTGRIADRLASTDAHVHVIHRPSKSGLGTANTAGMRFGLAHGAEFVITMDADFSHDPDYLPALLDGMGSHDVMIGSRYVPGGGTRNWGFGRRALSRAANVVARLVLALPAKDCTAGLRCYARRVLEAIDLDAIRSNGYAFQEEMLYEVHRRGFRIGETPILFVDRRAGKSKISRREVWMAMQTLLRLRLRRE